MLTTAQAAALACRRPDTIHDWVRRGIMRVAARDRRGWPLFEVEDVYASERLTRQRDTTTRTLEAIDRA